MKKLISVLLAMALAFSVTACGLGSADAPKGEYKPAEQEQTQSADTKTEDTETEDTLPDDTRPEEDNDFSLGTMQGGTYENAYIGIGCTLDENWTYKTAEEMQDISGNPDYDVARSEWGATWRIPKYAEVTELFNNCTRAEVDINGRKCIKLTSSINGKYIILPHTGWMSGMSNAYYNSYGRYWSSTPYLYNDYSAYYFSSAGSGLWENVRSWGLSVRPVSN